MQLNLKTLLRNIKIGFKNLGYWLPVIWNDRDWDYWFIYRILRHKLKSVYNEFEYGPKIVEKQEDMALEVAHCISILDRLIDDRYFEFTDDINKAQELKDTDKKNLFASLHDNIETWWT